MVRIAQNFKTRTSSYSGMLGSRISISRGPLARSFCAAAEPAKAKVSRRLRDNRPLLIQQRAKNAGLEASQAASGLNWRLLSATILHRYPVILSDPFPWEKAMYDMQERVENRRRELMLEELKDSDAQLLPESGPTYEEILESMPFKPADRVTEADRTNDRRSTDRRLQDSLFLIVKRNRQDHAWQFPQGKLREEEVLRTAAERVVDRAVGTVGRWFISNAPAGHFQYQYPDALQAQRKEFGAKVFYYRTQLLAGNIKLETRLYTDYAWVARDELHEYFDAETADYVKNILPL